MTDFELNKAIAEALGVYYGKSMFGCAYVWISGASPNVQSANYCNNWNDLMPLVVEYGITFNRDSCQCHVESYFYPSVGKISAPTGKLKRALAECLLKVLTQTNSEGQ